MSTPASQLCVHFYDMTVSAWTPVFHGKNWWEYHLYSKLLKNPAKSLKVTSNLVSFVTGGTVGAYEDKQEEIVAWRMDELLQTLCDILSSGSRQEAHFLNSQIWMTNWHLCSPQKGVTNHNHSSLPCWFNAPGAPNLGPLHFLISRLLPLPHAFRCLLLCFLLSNSTTECLIGLATYAYRADLAHYENGSDLQQLEESAPHSKQSDREDVPIVLLPVFSLDPVRHQR